MRMPSYENLSVEQDEICLTAPLDGATLISGPPGTGKTVIAFYRAGVAATQGQDPNLVMYNNVLHQYVSNASQDEKVQKGLDTWWTWFSGWWREVFRKFVPQFEPYSPNWEKMKRNVIELSLDQAAKGRALQNWGHLIVDEGQDFAPDFYRVAALILDLAASEKEKIVALTVLADENQRLNSDRNSTIGQIEECLGIAPERHYHLTRNYRNTYEIARTAAHFYCGLPGGIPALPEGRHGNIPRLIRTTDLDTSVDAIVRFVKNQSDLEVGVFLPNIVLQTKYFNKLSHRLKEVKRLKVQQYNNRNNDASSLKFDRPGTVTVLCDSSCKGLEFDAVFIPELQERRWDPASIDCMRMQFYVLSSRARQFLTFLYSAGTGEHLPTLEYFPDRQSELLEWIDG